MGERCVVSFNSCLYAVRCTPFKRYLLRVEESDRLLAAKQSLYLGSRTAGNHTYKWCEPHYFCVHMKNIIHSYQNLCLF